MNSAPCSPPEIEPPLAGMPAPDFTLPAVSGQSPITLSSLRGNPVVLAFTPPGWDPVRSEQMAQYRRLITGAGKGELIGLSRDGIWCQAAFADGQVQFPLLTDDGSEGSVSQLYGVTGQQALFVVDSEGIIRWSYIAASGSQPQPERLQEALQSLAAPAPRTALTRREFVAATLAAAFAIALPARRAQAQDPSAPRVNGQGVPVTPSAPTEPAVGTMPVTLQVNGASQSLQIEPRVTLLDALRERLNLTGSKKGCDHGQCGACTVHVDGRRVNSCLTLAIACQGKQITTIEGLAQGETLHPVQAAFIEYDGFQCGYCTPGQIMSAAALLHEPVGPEDADVRENMSGNICRCGAYPNIVAAIQQARKESGNAPV